MIDAYNILNRAKEGTTGCYYHTELFLRLSVQRELLSNLIHQLFPHRRLGIFPKPYGNNHCVSNIWFDTTFCVCFTAQSNCFLQLTI